jgi:hypothetical protein
MSPEHMAVGIGLALGALPLGEIQDSPCLSCPGSFQFRGLWSRCTWEAVPPTNASAFTNGYSAFVLGSPH